MTARELVSWLDTLGDSEVRVIGESNSAGTEDGARKIVGVFAPAEGGPDFYCIITEYT